MCFARLVLSLRDRIKENYMKTAVELPQITVVPQTENELIFFSGYAFENEGNVYGFKNQ